MAYGEIRIIGGTWRGRKLPVPDVPDLRPTPDRVRETLFNWLAPYIQGAYCLDPFAGSGALGFEALSRGAKHVVMVDQSSVVIKQLKENIQKLNAANAEVYQASVPEGLKKPLKPFDIIFLDPPFKKDLLLPICFFLKENDFLAKDAVIYVEAKDSLEAQPLPTGWKILKSKKAGQVYYHLIHQEF